MPPDPTPTPLPTPLLVAVDGLDPAIFGDLHVALQSVAFAVLAAGFLMVVLLTAVLVVQVVQR